MYVRVSFSSQKQYATLINYKKDPKRDPNLENYPFSEVRSECLFAAWVSGFLAGEPQNPEP